MPPAPPNTDWTAALAAQFALCLKREWVDDVVGQLRQQNADFGAWEQARVVERIFTAFLFADLNEAGAAALPPQVQVGVVERRAVGCGARGLQAHNWGVAGAGLPACMHGRHAGA